MNFLEDRKIRKIAKRENIKAPDRYLKFIDETLENITEEEKTKNNIKPI